MAEVGLITVGSWTLVGTSLQAPRPGIFPVEIRADAIAYVYAAGTLAGGVLAPDVRRPGPPGDP